MTAPRRLMLSSLVLCLFATVCPLASAAPSVALVVTAPAQAADWQAALAAEIGRASPATELVERAELARLWTDRELVSPAASPLGVDLYLHARRVAPDRRIVELIDASTGRARGSLAVETGDVSSAPRVAAAAVRLLDAPAPTAPTSRSPRLAVVESADSAGNAALFTLAARLRATLADEGVDVLDRALTQEIAVEQNDAARGFRAGPPPAASLLGLDHYLELAPSIARLVRVRDGLVLGLHPRTEPDPDEVNTLQRWALPLLGLSATSVTDYLPQVEIEALEPFYRGLAHHDAGRHAEAAAEFTSAYELNGRFREAYEWSARCHDALGLKTRSERGLPAHEH